MKTERITTEDLAKLGCTHRVTISPAELERELVKEYRRQHPIRAWYQRELAYWWSPMVMRMRVKMWGVRLQLLYERVRVRYWRLRLWWKERWR